MEFNNQKWPFNQVSSISLLDHFQFLIKRIVSNRKRPFLMGGKANDH